MVIDFQKAGWALVIKKMQHAYVEAISTYQTIISNRARVSLKSQREVLADMRRMIIRAENLAANVEHESPEAAAVLRDHSRRLRELKNVLAEGITR